MPNSQMGPDEFELSERLTSPEPLSEPVELPEQMALSHLIAECGQQTERFFRKEPSLDRFCHELLRRAFVLHHPAAWEAIYNQYRPLVAAWIQKHPSFATCNEEVAYFVNGAFARVQHWCTPERFAKFTTLAQWLMGLKACVNSEIIDYHRQQAALAQQAAWDAETVENAATTASASLTTAAPHATVADAAWRAEAWQLIQERLQSDQEVVLVEYSYVLGHKSREICALRRDLFPQIADVYRVKDNLLRRLRRDPVLRRLFDSMSE